MKPNSCSWLSKPFLTSLLLGIGGSLYGYDSGIITPSPSLLTVCYLTITVLAAVVYPAKPGFPTNEAAQRGLIACIFAVSAIYSALLGPMTWIIPPEVFTAELRAKANAIVQVLFIPTNALCAVVFAFFYPETFRGKSLEEIDELFGDVGVVRDVDGAEKAGFQEVEARQRK